LQRWPLLFSFLLSLSPRFSFFLHRKFLHVTRTDIRKRQSLGCFSDLMAELEMQDDRQGFVEWDIEACMAPISLQSFPWRMCHERLSIVCSAYLYWPFLWQSQMSRKRFERQCSRL
jgi:hypothetical protein